MSHITRDSERARLLHRRRRTITFARAAKVCVDCGNQLSPYPGIGRPRLRCAPCAANGAALTDWRSRHPDRVQAYNLARRERYRSVAREK
jgi:hypothetical protein